MSNLLNEVTTNESITKYDRSCGGSFENPYGQFPELTFNMHKVSVRNSDGKLIACEALPSVVEPFSPGKVYDLYDPTTGNKIPGQNFTAEMLYAFLYSTMISACNTAKVTKAALDAKLAAEAEAAAAAAAAEAKAEADAAADKEDAIAFAKADAAAVAAAIAAKAKADADAAAEALAAAIIAP